MNLRTICKVCLCVVIGIFIGYLIFNPIESTTIPVDKDYKEEVIKKDSVIRDSIYIVNDSIQTEIIYLEKGYDEKVSDILSNSDSINLCFFSEYIEHYNNERAAANNKPDIR